MREDVDLRLDIGPSGFCPNFYFFAGVPALFVIIIGALLDFPAFVFHIVA